jgi:hypothetical protein
MNASILPLTFALAISGVGQLTVTLKETHGSAIWKGYPESVGRVFSKWHGKALHVHVVEDQVGPISSSGITARPNGDDLVLCYVELPEPETTGDYQLGGPIVAVGLDFTVTGLERRDYKVTVSNHCSD